MQIKKEEDYDFLRQEIKSEFPKFKIIRKDLSTFMKAIDFSLKIITFGKMKTFMNSFVTTIGTTMYVPKSWLNSPVTSRLSTMRHERVHMRQSKKYGSFLFSFLYLFFPLPVLFASYRRKFEQEAYEESIASMYEYYGIDMIKQKVVRDRIIDHFTSAEYFWTWPWKKSLNEWYDTVIRKFE